ncbi:tyrosine-type recombinase/integrase [Photobacterium sp. WH77]|uniref:phage integrase n=1 Tax=unclassified Photobacterium TaxID=2628852 RepID=UPI001EDA42E6|nr:MULTISPECIES: tyrosine-type recombinase/integrase [unclassified Photobacterium]MCG2836504.1 tyrosine-type recombinase/integrase [Photobacterium sp. WH77]MCG2844369.1 tyrosine-type recombinase/integrase [Photobacterium sp. WH80]
MSIKKDGDKWLVDIRPAGRDGKRFRRKFDKKAEALAYEKYILARAHNKEWLGPPVDNRKLSELIEIWWKKSGQFKRTASNYLKKLELICSELGDPPVNKIDNKLLSDWVHYRQEKGQKPATISRLISTVSNVFTVLTSTGDFTGTHPIKGFKLPKITRREMTFLTESQISQLLDAVKHDKELMMAVEICLATGSRWRETITLKASNLSPYRIRFTNTKTGKPRTVPISEELYNRIYPKSGSDVFSFDPQAELYEILEKLDFGLPKGQKVHVLRHTFASHFIMAGGNILTLRDILGHSSIAQTMAYAHLAPDHLVDAVRFNPLSKMADSASTLCPH